MEKEHLEVILKSIDSKFDLVLEGHEILNRKIDDLAKNTEERFDLVDFKIDTLNDKIDAVASDLKETDARLGNKIRCSCRQSQRSSCRYRSPSWYVSG